MRRPVIVACIAAAAVLLTSNSASAEVTKLDIRQGNSNGYGTNCRYTVTATTTSDVPVTFTDIAGATFSPLPVITPTGDSATVSWIPNAPGPHLITASQGDNVQTLPLTVGMGVNTGSTSCRVF